MSASLRRRALVATVTAGLLTIAGFASAPSASAHPCARAQVNGTGVGPCHAPPAPDQGHALCQAAEVDGSTYVIACTP